MMRRKGRVFAGVYGQPSIIRGLLCYTRALVNCGTVVSWATMRNCRRLGLFSSDIGDKE